jgi:hypothetical protein
VDGIAKKIPLLLVGEKPSALDAYFARVRALEGNSPAEFFYLFEIHGEEEKEFVAAAEKSSLPKDQIIFLARPELFKHLLIDKSMGSVDFCETENLLSLRQRIYSAVEIQRHKILQTEVEKARDSGLVSSVTAEDWILAVEIAHLTHAVSLSLELTLLEHREAIRRSLRAGPHGQPDCWDAGFTLPELVSLVSSLAHRSWPSPAKFREDYRNLSAKISFRLRTDLKNAIERCMERAWRENDAA